MDQNYCSCARLQILSEEQIGLAIPMTAPASRGIVHEPSGMSGYLSESASEWDPINQLRSTFLYDDSSESENESEDEDNPTVSNKLSSECAAGGAQPPSPRQSRSQSRGPRGIHPRASTLNCQGQQIRPFAQYHETYEGRKDIMEDRRIQVAAQVAMLPILLDETQLTDMQTATTVAMVGVQSRSRGEYFHDVQPLADGTFVRSATPTIATVRQVNMKRRQRVPVPQRAEFLYCALCKPLPALPPLPQEEVSRPI